MSSLHSSEQKKSTYLVDAENAAEIARLIVQDRMVTKEMGGLFAEQREMSLVHDVLDLACGPGGWALDVAQTYPYMHVIGVDMSKGMLSYAQSQAISAGIKNIDFLAMNILQPLAFPDQSFDLINGRFLLSFMLPTAWPGLLRECWRILRPGGILRLTEAEAMLTNSPSTERLTSFANLALYRMKQSFSPDGRNIGITPMLRYLQMQAGFTPTVQCGYAIDFSAGTEAYTTMYQNYATGYKLMQPLFIKLGLATQEEVDMLYQRMLSELQQEDFCGIWYLYTSCARKAA